MTTFAIPGGREHRANWEATERMAVLQYVQPGDFVIEGGVGSGTVTAAIDQAGARVVGYEPQAPQLRHLWPFGDRIPVVPAALGAQSGFVDLVTDSLPNEWWVVHTRPGSLIQQIDTPDLVGAMRPDGLVLDVEGSEHGIIAALRWLPRWLVAELHPPRERIDATLDVLRDRYPVVTIHSDRINVVVGCRR